MNHKQIKLGKVVETISNTYKFQDDQPVVFINTGDILEGKFLHSKRSNPSSLPGQAKKSIKKGDILFSEIRPANKRYALVDFDADDYVVSTKLMVLRPKNNIDPQYLYIWLTMPSTLRNFQMIAESRSGTFPQITFEAIKNEEIPYPPLSEQKRISSILSSFDNKIEQLKKENNILEDIAQNIFKEWFVKYNFPNKDGKPYKDNNGKMINSELGLIPEGWRVVSLTDIADFVNGLPMQKYRPKEGQAFLPVIKIKELNSGYSKETEKARTDLDEKYIVNPGDLVFSWSGSIGMDLWKYSKGALNQHLFKVTSTKYPKWFYYYWIKHYLPEFKQIAEGKATTMGHIQRGHLANSLLPAPKDFKNYELFEAILQKEINNNKNINNLNEQKLSNLKYLIN